MRECAGVRVRSISSMRVAAASMASLPTLYETSTT
jgi:hypothetical protein